MDDELDEIIRILQKQLIRNMMGTDRSVVDDTKVYGVKNLRIVDSILPDIVSGKMPLLL